MSDSDLPIPLPPLQSVADALHVRLFAAGALHLSAGQWSAHRVQDTFWRCYFNADEGAAVELDDGLYPLLARRLILVPAGVRFSCRNARALGHFYVHFDVIGMPRAALTTLFGAPLTARDDAPLRDAAAQLARDLSEDAELDWPLQCRLKSLIYAVLAACLADLPAADVARFAQLRAAHALVQPALEHIESHLNAPLAVGKLASLCGLNADYFSRQFRASLGQTPARYIREQRVQRAAQRLLFGAESIEQIAAATGFANRFHFSRVFARTLGVSPAAYRKSARI